MLFNLEIMLYQKDCSLFKEYLIQKAKYLTILKENYVKIEVELGKYVKVGSECYDI